jgi:ribosomal protein S27E
MSTTHLFNIDLPPEVMFQSGKASGSNVTCLDCGLDWEAAWDDDSEVWAYEVDNEGIGVWVKATCNGCGRVEIFTTPGGKASGYVRELRDLDRKHREMHGLWLREKGGEA